MRDALHARAAQLPASGGRYVEFGDDTDDALESGCTGAALALVERSLQVATTQAGATPTLLRSEEHTSELQSLMRISYAVFCLTKKTNKLPHNYHTQRELK